MLGPRDPDDYLLPTERRVIRVRRHWAALMLVLVKSLGVLIAAVGLAYVLEGDNEIFYLLRTVLWYTALATVLYFGYHVLEWWVELIVITDKRFLITSGIIVTKISMMPITKVTDMSYLRSFAGRLLGYGTLRVESAGQKQDLERVSYLPKPEATFDAISELIFGEKKQARPALRPPPPRKRWSFAR